MEVDAGIPQFRKGQLMAEGNQSVMLMYELPCLFNSLFPCSSVYATSILILGTIVSSIFFFFFLMLARFVCTHIGITLSETLQCFTNYKG
jgi:hypothetical protein